MYVYKYIDIYMAIDVYILFIYTHTRAHSKSDTHKCKACLCISCAEKPFHLKSVCCGRKKTYRHFEGRCGVVCGRIFHRFESETK